MDDRTRYFEWLLRLVRMNRKYDRLLRFLFDHEFRWDPTIDTDANRAEDGKVLRIKYFEDTGKRLDVSVTGSNCSILEMLVALSLRIEEDIMGDPGYFRPGRWVKEMLANLDLLGMTNDSFDERHVIDQIRTWMGRGYAPSGRGGLFPIRNVWTDQRRVPIWDQMSEYILEIGRR